MQAQPQFEWLDENFHYVIIEKYDNNCYYKRKQEFN